MANLNQFYALKDSVARNTDPFTDGDVIQWLSTGTYSYSANRAGGKWYISGTANFYGAGTHSGISYSRLVQILSRGDVSDIRHSTGWSEVIKPSGLSAKKVKKNGRRAAAMRASRNQPQPQPQPQPLFGAHMSPIN